MASCWHNFWTLLCRASLCLSLGFGCRITKPSSIALALATTIHFSRMQQLAGRGEGEWGEVHPGTWYVYVHAYVGARGQPWVSLCRLPDAIHLVL